MVWEDQEAAKDSASQHQVQHRQQCPAGFERHELTHTEYGTLWQLECLKDVHSMRPRPFCRVSMPPTNIIQVAKPAHQDSSLQITRTMWPALLAPLGKQGQR